MGHALTQLAVAILLLVTSLVEVSQTLVDDVSNLRLRATHGLLIVGLWQVLRTVPDLIEGIERCFESSGAGERES